MSNYIFSIDPGNEYSAYAILDIDSGLKPIRFGKVGNDELLEIIYDTFHINVIREQDGISKANPNIKHVAIEMVASYGMPVGATVFETCVWIGRFFQAILEQSNVHPALVYRKDEKMCLCGSMKAKDGNIRQALIDRFGYVGTKKNPGWFYGVSKDVWSAIAVGVTYHDMYIDCKWF